MDLVTFAPRFPRPGETVVGNSFLTYTGGKGANQAVAVSRMGTRSAMVGRVGGDIFGPQLLDGLTTAGVDITGVGINPNEMSGIAVIGIDETAQNCITQILRSGGSRRSKAPVTQRRSPSVTTGSFD